MTPDDRTSDIEAKAVQNDDPSLRIVDEQPDAVTYRHDIVPDTEQAIALYEASTLGRRRPIDDPEAMRAMLQHANLIVTAWRGDRLVGIARTLTDFVFVAYLSDLAVDQRDQRRGIGTGLIAATRRRLGPRCKIVLISAPAAVEYYPRIGFEAHPSAWTLGADQPLRNET